MKQAGTRAAGAARSFLRDRRKMTCLALLFVWLAVNAFLFARFERKITPAHIIRGFLIFSSLTGMFLIAVGRGRALARIGAVLFIAAASIASAANILFYFYFKITRTSFGPNVVTAMLQTNPGEAHGFLLDNMPTGRIVLAAAFMLASALLLTFAFLIFRGDRRGLGRAGYAGLILCAAACLFFSGKNKSIAAAVDTYVTYQQELEIFKQEMENLKNIDVAAATKTGEGEVLVVIVGESNTRDQMHNYAGIFENTPWLDRMEESEYPGWIKFQNAYSHFTHTLQAIRAMLSEDRAYTGSTFPRNQNVISICRSAGIATAWLSNQAPLGVFDTLIAAFANTADKTEFVLESGFGYKDKNYSDDKLVPMLERHMAASNPNLNQLVIVHLFGSHSPFDFTYPHDFPEASITSRKFLGKYADNPKHAKEFSAYQTSIAFLDTTLAGLHSVLEKYDDRPVAMLYLPDHGQEVGDRKKMYHFIETYTWSKSRIPMYLWLSSGYRERYPEKYGTLNANAAKFFTNDLLYDMVLGLLSIKTPHYEEKYDIGSAKYGVTEENAELALERMVRDDDALAVARNAAIPGLAVHRCNTLFKLRQAKSFGIRRYEVDLFIGDDAWRKGERKLSVGHEEATYADMDLREYLGEAAPGMEFLWLDIKDMNFENHRTALDILEELDRDFSLKSRVLVECYDPKVVDVFMDRGWTASYYLGYMLREHAGDDAFFAGVARNIDATRGAVSFDLMDKATVYEKILPLAVRKPEKFVFSTDAGASFDNPALPEFLRQYEDVRPKAVLIGFPSHYSL